MPLPDSQSSAFGHLATPPVYLRGYRNRSPAEAREDNHLILLRTTYYTTVIHVLSGEYGPPGVYSGAHHRRTGVPMDRPELEHLLEQVSAEKASVEHQIVVLQARLTALATTADGVQALLETTPTAAGWIPSVDTGAGHTANTVPGGSAGQAVRAPQDLGGKVPKGKDAAGLILQSDQSRRWSVREVWDEQVRRGWAEPRPKGRKGNPPARIALMRLQQEHPENVEVTEYPVLSYRWISEPSLSLNGSGASHTEETR